MSKELCRLTPRFSTKGTKGTKREQREFHRPIGRLNSRSLCARSSVEMENHAALQQQHVPPSLFQSHTLGELGISELQKARHRNVPSQCQYSRVLDRGCLIWPVGGPVMNFGNRNRLTVYTRHDVSLSRSTFTFVTTTIKNVIRASPVSAGYKAIFSKLARPYLTRHRTFQSTSDPLLPLASLFGCIADLSDPCFRTRPYTAAAIISFPD